MPDSKNIPGVPAQWEKSAQAAKKKYKKFLERADIRKTMRLLPELHEEAFSKINCLDCARCCRNYSPRFKTPDIKRISKLLGMKESAFIHTYLKLDGDGDYVLQETPCPFIEANNTCRIYEDRPSDCARYPYTDEDVLLKRPALTLKNSEVCPAVFTVLEILSNGGK